MSLNNKLIGALFLFVTIGCSDNEVNAYESSKFPFDNYKVTIGVEDEYGNLLTAEQYASLLKVYNCDSKSFVDVNIDDGIVMFEADAPDINSKSVLLDIEESEKSNDAVIGIYESHTKSKISIADQTFIFDFTIWFQAFPENFYADSPHYIRSISCDDKVIVDKLGSTDTPTITFVYENGTYKLKK